MSETIVGLSVRHNGQMSNSRYLVKTGATFGSLTTLRISGSRSGSVLWSCACKCGRQTNIEGRHLLNGARDCCRNCTAVRREEKQIREKIGQRFGHWTIIGVTTRTGNRTVLYDCRCTCGNIEKKRSEQLTSGRSKQCKRCSYRDCSQRKRGKVRVSVEHRLKVLFLSRLDRYRRGAIDRNLEWKLSDEDCKSLFASNCHYCGAVPSNRAADPGRGLSFFYSGIDRRDNSAGYTPANVVPCCGTCNQQKSDRSASDFIEHALRIAALHGRSV